MRAVRVMTSVVGYTIELPLTAEPHLDRPSRVSACHRWRHQSDARGKAFRRRTPVQRNRTDP